MWVRHGGPERFGSVAGDLTAVGQLSALLGSFSVLVLLVLISRLPWLEHRFGMDRLNHWHRWVGMTAMTLLTTHVLASTVGFAVSEGAGLGKQVVDFVLYYPNLLAAIVGFCLLIAVAAFSARAARRALKYETWWAIHLYAYLGVALSFAHQITTGTDFVRDTGARAYWITLYAATAVGLLWCRWLLPIARAFRYRLWVAEVVFDSHDVVSITLRGRGVVRLPVEAGQFFLLRFLRRDRWWKAHPFSLSAAPDGRNLRFTIKALGDDSAALRSIPVGTRVMAEGPYGAFGAARATRAKVALIGAGIGITPLRALLEEFDRPPGHVAVVYRIRRREDAVLLDELRQIAGAKGYPLFVSHSREGSRAETADPLHPRALLKLIPDIAERSVFVCGPAPMLQRARTALRQAGVRRDQILYERFSY
jgi:predicted ferric reductase